MANTDFLSEYSHHTETAAALNVSPRTLARYESEPNGLPYVMIGGRKYHHTETVRNWITKRMRRPNPKRAA